MYSYEVLRAGKYGHEGVELILGSRVPEVLRTRHPYKLELVGGISVQSGLSEGREKRGRTHTRAGKKSGACGVREWSEKEGK